MPMRLAVIGGLTAALAVVLCLSPVNSSAVELKTHYQEASVPKYILGTARDHSDARGVCTDILRAIEADLPAVQVTVDRAVPFTRILHDLTSGAIDLFCGMTRTEEREERYVYLEPPVYGLNFVVAVRADDPVVVAGFDDIRRLAPDNVMLTNTGTGAERFLKKQGGLQIDASGPDIVTNLRKLRKGRGRFFFFHDMGIKATIKQRFKGRGFRVLPASYRSYNQYIGYSRNSAHPEMAATLQRTIEKLDAQGKLKTIFDAYTKVE